MKNLFYAAIILPMIVFSGQACGRVHRHGGDCSGYTGEQKPLPAADAKFLSSVIDTFKKGDRRGVLATADRKLQLIRRFGFGVDARGGNLWLDLAPRQIDRKLWIHIDEMTLPSYLGEGEEHYDKQVLQEFSFFGPKFDGTGTFINRKVCDGVKKCYVLPAMNGVENLVGSLLYCSHYKSNTFVFSDGILLTDMEDVEGAGLPMGEALFFVKTPTGYLLSTLISFQ